MKLIIKEDYNLEFNYKPIYHQFYYNNGRKIEHNLLGPALICKNGQCHYYIHGSRIGINLSNKEFEQEVKRVIFSS